MKPRFFATPEEFRAWLERHHDTATELWIGLYKKASGKPSITWPEAVDEALCFGWIDGVRKSIDDESYMNRFTPRKPTSNWSAVNVKRVEAEAAGPRSAAGLKAFRERRRAKTGDYSYEQRHQVKLDPAFEKRFRRRRGPGVVPGATALLPDDRRLLGDEREEARDAGAAARAR